MSVRAVPSSAEALQVAEAVYRSKYNGASFAYAAGSILRGHGKHYSDIDLVVVFDSLEAAYRESFVFNGIPVEASVHDAGTLAWFIDHDVLRVVASMLHMIVEGEAIGGSLADAEKLRRAVSTRFHAGPPAFTSAGLDLLRYEITDAINDSRGDRSEAELLAIGSILYPKLAELSLSGRGQLNGSGKWLPRLLAAVDGGLIQRFDAAFRALFSSGSCDGVIALAEAELDAHGGPLFEGHHRTAPSSCRA